jgi:undecaprenyl-diphosphatase
MRDLLDVDRRLYLLLNGRLRARWFDPVMVCFTRAGTKGAVWLGVCAVLLIAQGWHALSTVVLTMAALLLTEGIINLLLKPAVGRERPFARGVATLLIKAPGPHSWPSAHAGSSMAAALVLTYTYHWWGILFLAVALLIAYSRVYVGVHYPLDVLAGLVIGVVCALTVIVAALLLRPIVHVAL